MKKLKLVYKNYLNETGLLKLEKLGTGAPPKITFSQNKNLKNRLTSRLEANNSHILLTLIAFCCLFFMSMGIALYHKNNAVVLVIIFLSLLIFSLAFLYYLRQRWLEKNMLDISLSIIDDLPPEEATKFIQVIYWKLLNK